MSFVDGEFEEDARGSGLEKKCLMDFWTFRPSFALGDGVDEDAEDEDMSLGGRQ